MLSLYFAGVWLNTAAHLSNCQTSLTSGARLLRDLSFHLLSKQNFNVDSAASSRLHRLKLFRLMQHLEDEPVVIALEK